MKKALSIAALIVAVALLCSFSWTGKEWQKEFTYKDPQTVGGKWDLTTADGTVYEGIECTYWGTDDDTAMFRLPDGRMLAMSGSYSLVQSKEVEE